MTILLQNGKELSTKLTRFSKLKQANENQLNNWCFIDSGVGIHWNEINQDILIKNLLKLG